MATRSIVFIAAAGVLGLFAGSVMARLQMLPARSLQRENAILRKQVQLQEELIDNYKAELADIRKLLDGRQ